VTAAGVAASCGSQFILTILLEAGASPNVVTKKGVTPLALAISRNNLPCIEELLKFGASLYLKDPTYVDFSPVFLSIQSGSLEEIEMICDYRPDLLQESSEEYINSEGCPILHLTLGRIDVLNYLSLRIKDIDQTDGDGNSVLMKLLVYTPSDVSFKEAETMALRLIKRGAKINF